MTGTKIAGDTYYTIGVKKDKRDAQLIQEKLKKEDRGNRVRITGPHFGYYFVRARHISNASINAKYKASNEERVRKGRIGYRSQ